MKDPDIKITKFLECLAVASIIGIFALRSYAAFFTQPVVTYDDKHYRAAALFLDNHISTPLAIKEVFLPASRHLRERTIGYISWLVLGQKFLGAFDMERRWQIVNLLLFSLQALFMYFLALWASKKEWFASALTALYVSMPMIFGMNRWIMNENFVFPALLAFPLCAVLVIGTDRTQNKEPRTRQELALDEICLPAAAAYLMGIFARLREYAFPSLLAIVAVIIITFAVKKRWVALWVFTAVFTPFCVAAARAVIRVMSYTIQKAGILRDHIHPDVASGKYYAPWYDWGYRLVVRTLGPAMTIFLCAGAAFLGYLIYSSAAGYFRSKNSIKAAAKKWTSGIPLLFACLLALSALYAAGVILSPTKTLRIPMVPAISFLAAILIGIRTFNGAERYISSIRLKKFLIILLFMSWITMLYQLFIPYGGGKDFFIRPYYMPTYNHPMHIRKLEGRGDWHVVESGPEP